LASLAFNIAQRRMFRQAVHWDRAECLLAPATRDVLPAGGQKTTHGQGRGGLILELLTPATGAAPFPYR